ncbi:MAG: 3-hydroxyacyl-CoA dehydrogenase NAD-binding domain-containing protein [Alphaproteobacteria bacterium]
MTDVIKTDDREGVRIITIDNAPVNAISAAVRSGLLKATQDAIADPKVKAIVVTGAGRAFVAGADIREFGKPAAPGVPNLRDNIAALEASPKTVVAALNGVAVRRGLEIALGCHYRVAHPKAPLGLPEVNLGTIPGATGTQRLPRAVGVEAALDMIVGASLIPAAKCPPGLADEIAEDCVGRAVAMALAKPVPRLSDDDSNLASAKAKPALFDDYRKGMARRFRGFTAPFKAVEAIELCVKYPFAQGSEKERELFVWCQGQAEARAMRHVFFAERDVARSPWIPKDAKPREIKSAGIIGCGTMGGGIAMNFANAGIPVTVVENDAAALARGLGIIRRNYAGPVEKGRMKQEEMDRRMGLIRGSTTYEDLKDADIVIEAAFENLALKREIFGKLDKIAKPGAVLATNTSTLDVDAIAEATKRPECVVGTHFFSPANVMRLLENVKGKKTSPETAQTAMELGRRINKVAVLVGVCDGFVGNRMLYAYSRQAGFLLDEGATPEQVDKAIYDFGFPMGPFQMSDLAGIDVGYLVRKERREQAPTNKRYAYTVADRLYEMGRYGQKTGRGFYLYDAERNRKVDPEVTALVEQVSKENGRPRRAIGADEIVERCMYALVNEGAKILEEGIAARPLDIDMIWIFGYGFPRYRGGPMHWADEVGLPKLLERLEHYYRTADRDWLEPAPLLRRLVKEGKKFREWSAA